MLTLMNEIMSFAATKMDLDIVILSEVSQRSRNIIWYSLYIKFKKKWYQWTYKTEKTHRVRVAREKDRGEG